MKCQHGYSSLWLNSTKSGKWGGSTAPTGRVPTFTRTQNHVVASYTISNRGFIWMCGCTGVILCHFKKLRHIWIIIQKYCLAFKHLIQLLVPRSPESKQISTSSHNHLVQDVDRALEQCEAKCVKGNVEEMCFKFNQTFTICSLPI